jgi:hypothetical protein
LNPRCANSIIFSATNLVLASVRAFNPSASRVRTKAFSTELFALSFLGRLRAAFSFGGNQLTKFTTRLHHRCRNKKTRTGNPLCGAKLPVPVELPQRAFFAVQKLYRQSQTFNRLSGWDAAPNAFAKEMTDGE